MAKADGTILIDTKINSDGAEAGTKELEAAARRLANSLNDLGEKARIALQKQVDSFAKLNNQYAEQAKKVDELKRKVAEYENQKVPTQEYADIQQQIDGAQKKLDGLIEKQRKFVELGGKTNSRAYKSMQYDIDELSNSIKYAKGELEDLERTGKAFTYGMDTDAAQKDMERLAKEEAKLSDMNNRLRTSYQSLEQKVKDYRDEILKTDKGQKQLSKSSNRAGMSITKMLGTSILFSFVFQAINGVMNAAAEGMNNLAQYSDETNATLSMLLSSLTQLKNAFATAFSPILTAIAPALNYLINLLTAAATAVAQLAAVLTGKGTFVKATKVQQDYAASLKETGSAASSAGKDAKKSLAPFDDLVQIQQQGADAGGGGGGGTDVSPSEMFEEVAVSNTLVSALETLKGIWEEVQQLFLSGFQVGFGNTAALDTIRQGLISIRDCLRDIFTDPEVLAAANDFSKTIIYNLGVVAGSVASVGVSIGANLIGGLARYLESAQERIKEYLINMFDISSDIATIIGDFSAAFANIFSVFGEENGQQLTANIIGIFSEAFMGLTELAAKVGRDVLDLLLTPLTENQEGFKSAFDGVLQVLSTVFGELRTIVEDTFSSINQVYDAHIRPMVESFVQGLTTIYQTALRAFNEYILPALQTAAEEFGAFREEHLQPLIDAFLEFGGKVADVITEVWENILVPFVSWFMETLAPVISQCLDVVIAIFFDLAGAITDIATTILDVLGNILSFIEDIFTGEWRKTWEQVKQDAKSKWDSIKNNLIQTWNNLKQNAQTKFTEIKNGIQEKWQNVKDDTAEKWESIKSNLSETWENVRVTASNKFSEVRQKISDAWQQTKQDTSEKWSNIKTELSTTWDSLKEKSGTTFDDLKNGVISAWETLKGKTKEIWDGIVGIIKGCVNGVVSAIEGMVNSVIDAVNWVIRQINKISIDVPDTPFSDGFSIGFDIPTLDKIELPRLASGTVIPPRAGEFAAILGDNNRESEIVSPVSAIKQALLEAMQEAGGMSGAGQNITIRFEGSMSSLARALKPELDRETARRGTNLVIIGGR